MQNQKKLRYVKMLDVYKGENQQIYIVKNDIFMQCVLYILRHLSYNIYFSLFCFRTIMIIKLLSKYLPFLCK